VKLVGNHVYGGDAWQPTAFAVLLGQASGTLVANNVIYGGSQSAPAAATAITAIKINAPATGVQVAHNTIFSGFASAGKIALALQLNGFNSTSPAGDTLVDDNVFIGTGASSSAGLSVSTCPAMSVGHVYGNTFVNTAWGAIPTGSNGFTGCSSFASGFSATTGLTNVADVASYDALLGASASASYPDHDASCAGGDPGCSIEGFATLADAYTSFLTPANWAPLTTSPNVCAFVSAYDDTAIVPTDFDGVKRATKPTAGAFEIMTMCP
jgi:hypothetical protein